MSDRATKGVVAVEMALMLPIILLFLVIIVDLGILLRDHQIITNGVREGARFSSLQKNDIGSNNPAVTAATIKQYVINYCSEEGLSVPTAAVTVNQGRSIAITGGQLNGSEINITYDRPVLFLGAFGGAPTVTLRSGAIFSNLY